MKKMICMLLCLATLFAFAGCFPTGQSTTTTTKKNDVLDGNDKLLIPEGYKKVTLDDQAGVNIYGTSVEFDPHFFSQNVQKDIVDEEDWQIIVDRVAKMGIDRFRVMLLPSWIEPLNDDDDPNHINWDNLTTENVEMKSVYKVLDLAEQYGIDVNVTLWGAENNTCIIDTEVNKQIQLGGGHFLEKGNENGNWVKGTLYPEEFAENFSIFIQQFKKKGYTCVKEITPCNEPNSFYLIGQGVTFESYAELCLAIHDRFVKDGIREDVKFNLSDNTDGGVEWLAKVAAELDEITDIYNSHTYIFGYGTANSTIYDWEINNMNCTRPTGKPHVIGEFGSNQCIGSTRQTDIDTYERGVLIVREMLNFYNAGAAGTSYWVLFDQYYANTDTYQQMMQLGLWKATKRAYISDTEYYNSVNEDYEVRPQYYAFSLFSKYVPKGAETYPIYLNDDFAVGTAFKGNDGKWVYVFANGNAEGDAMKIALHNIGAYGEFEKFVYAEGSLPTGDALIEASETVKVQNQVLSFELAPETVILFKQK